MMVAVHRLVLKVADEDSPPVTQPYDWYGFGLVRSDSSKPRMSIASGTDWVWMRQAGHELSEFLGVPLIDRLYHGTSAGAGSGFAG